MACVFSYFGSVIVSLSDVIITLMPFILVLSAFLDVCYNRRIKLLHLQSTILVHVVRALMSVTLHVLQVFCNGRVKWMHICCTVRDRVLSLFVAVASHGASLAPCSVVQVVHNSLVASY